MRFRPPPTMDMESLIEAAVAFHGHLGPFMVLGLKAGLIAVEARGRNPHQMRAIVETAPSRPWSCFVDGVQFSSGCTLGKGNIELREGSGLSALFVSGEKRLRATVKPSVLSMLTGVVEGAVEDEELERMALNFAGKSGDELFEIEA